MPLPPLSFVLSFFLFFFLSSAAANHPNAPQDLVRSSCLHASYPSLCIHTLSSYSGPPNSPRALAQAAVTASLERAAKVSDYLRTLPALRSRRERVAVSDCVDQIADSVDELRKALGELRRLRGETFRWQMSNAQTWVSAALTDEDTCMDGFEAVESTVKGDLKRRITNVARVTSNALYLINRLDESRGKPRFQFHDP